MPTSGEIKWFRNDRLLSKKILSDEIDIATNAANWSVTVLTYVAEHTFILNNWLSSILAAAATAANIFYNEYRAGLQELFENIEALPSNQTFYIQQKYRWHAGHRSWQPLNEFSVKTA